MVENLIITNNIKYLYLPCVEGHMTSIPDFVFSKFLF